MFGACKILVGLAIACLVSPVFSQSLPSCQDASGIQHEIDELNKEISYARANSKDPRLRDYILGELNKKLSVQVHLRDRCREGKSPSTNERAGTRYGARIEQEQVIDFVRGHKDVIQKLGTNLDIYPSLSRRTNDGQLLKMSVSVRPKTSLRKEDTYYALVRISQASGGANLVLECIGRRSDSLMEGCS